MKIRAAFLTFIWMLAASVSLYADGAFHCEVLAVDGDVRVMTAAGGSSTLKEGDLLSEGDSIEVSDDGSLDVAYDKEWRNVARFEGGTKAKLSAIVPAKIEMAEGGVYAKLKNLPNGTSFEVKTPTAVAAVRGTEYRTVVKDGESEVFNFSPSRVYVYGVDNMGITMTEPTVLDQHQKTAVETKGENPEKPAPMAADDKKACEASQKAIETQIEHAVTAGRVGKIQTIDEIENRPSSSSVQYDEESNVSDARRRSFK
jgi:hypothetical protein